MLIDGHAGPNLTYGRSLSGVTDKTEEDPLADYLDILLKGDRVWRDISIPT